MKQSITKKQWDELSDEEKTMFFNSDPKGEFHLPRIGELIEFVKDDLEQIYHYQRYVYTWSLDFYDREGKAIETMDLCDALWEAVKKKLKT